MRIHIGGIEFYVDHIPDGTLRDMPDIFLWFFGGFAYLGAFGLYESSLLPSLTPGIDCPRTTISHSM